MPLGDSITRGMGGDQPYEGYRRSLYNMLINDGWDVDFVGSQSDGNAGKFDTDHEGHGGWKADEIDQNVTQWIEDAGPNIVLLHIGTNDISSGQSNSSTISEIESILDKIYAYNEQVIVLLCKLIPRINLYNENEELNSLIEQLYENKKYEAGYNIYLVDQNTAFKANENWQTDYLVDNVHPSSVGYSVMANVFFNVLRTVAFPELTLTLLVNPEGGGNVNADPDKDNYFYNERVTLTAVPNANYEFSHWSGDIDINSSNPRSIIMIRDRTIVANFINDYEEFVSTPSKPTGPTQGNTGDELSFLTGGSTSNMGHEVEYQFDWGDGSQSTWAGVTRKHIYGGSGIYEVRARARCKTHNDIVSSWSDPLVVDISGETAYVLTTWANPTGGGTVVVDPDKPFYDENERVLIQAIPANSNYQFKYWSGDIDTSEMNPRYIYMVRSRTIVANFSGDVAETVSTPNVPTGPTSGDTGLNLTFSTGGSTSSLGNDVEYRFDWGDGNQSSWGSATRSYSYSFSGTYQVRAQARSVPNPLVLSGWSGTHTVEIDGGSGTYSLTIDTDPQGVGRIEKEPNLTLYESGQFVELTAYPEVTDPITDKVYIEAESGSLIGPIQIGDDTNASDDKYIFPTSSVLKSASAEYSFEIFESGTYQIWGRIYALSGTEDSFFMVVNANSDTMTWHLGSDYYTWKWRKLSDNNVVQSFNLSQGVHTLSVVTRDINARLDKLILSKDPNFQPSGKESNPPDPNKTYRFDYWSGDLTGSNNPATMTMSSNKTVTAHFVETDETVSTPSTPSGPSSGLVSTNLTFSTGGSSSSLGNPVEYQFDWGDGTQSDWGGASRSKSYFNTGTYEIQARARSATNTQIISNWSSPHTLSITDIQGNLITINVVPEGAGTVSREPYKSLYNPAEWVQLTAMPKEDDDNIRIEAESGRISGAVAIGNETEASGGQYIYGTTRVPAAGSVEYDIEIKESGNYYIWGRCFALSPTEDSFFILVDGGVDTLTWHLDADYNVWKWQRISHNFSVRQFSLNPGWHTLTVITRDMNTRLDNIIFTKDPTFQPSGKEEYVFNVKVEGESGNLTGPIAIGNDTQASGNQYVYGTSAVPMAAKAEYTFNINTGGTYYIWGRCYALSGTEDSFFFQLDGNPTLTWHLSTQYHSWIWQKVSHDHIDQEFALAKGEHKITILTRDINSRLDKLIITRDANYVPSGKEDTPSARDVVYRFDHWEGDLTGNSNPVDLMMDSDKTITAFFVEAQENVTIPDLPTGPSTGKLREELTFSTGGAISSEGNNVEYQFDWGDRTTSGWASETQSHAYLETGSMQVKARARSVADTNVVSNWTEPYMVNITGFILTVLVEPASAGEVSKTPDKIEYAYNDTVTLIPSSESGFLFDHWEEGLTGNSNPAMIVMRSDKTVRAVFARSNETVSRPTSLTGPDSGVLGEVLSFVTDGAESNLGHEVEYQFDWGNGQFSLWGDKTCDYVYNNIGNYQVKSRARCETDTNVISQWSDFHEISITGLSLTIKVNPSGVGAVTINPQKKFYAINDNVQLTVMSVIGYRFVQWSGDLTGDTNPAILMMNSSKQVTANFEKTQEIVTKPTFISGPDSGFVDENLTFSTGGSMNNLGNGVEYQFDWGNGTLTNWGDSTRGHVYYSVGDYKVKARARSKENTSVVSEWTDAHNIVILDVYFSINLSVEPVGAGSVNRTPHKSEYSEGEMVVLTPIPVYGYVFDYWSGDLNGIDNPAIIFVQSDKNIVANFKQISDVAESQNEIPDNFALHQNYPNPFNPETIIKYELPKSCHVKITVFNVHGQQVKTIVNEYQNEGYHKIIWRGLNDTGQKVPSGVYIYHFQADDFYRTCKMILMK